MEVERKEFEWTDIKVIIEKRKKKPPAMKSKQTPRMKNAQVHAVQNTKHKGTATCNIGVTAMNQECQTQLTGIDVITQTPKHGIAEEIKRENQKRILAEQRSSRERRLKQLKEAEKKTAENKAAEKKAQDLRVKKALDEAEKLEKERQERILQDCDPTYAKRKSKKKNKNKNKKKSNYLNEIVALDCEMVGVNKRGKFSVLARACVVSGHGKVLLDEYCSSQKKVTNYRTHISGIEEKHMKNAQHFSALQHKVKKAIAGKIVVGHGLSHDFQALRIDHPESMKRDTAEYFIGKFLENQRPGLKTLAKDQLGLDIQEGAHSPVIDAKAALDIYLKHRGEWEKRVVNDAAEHIAGFLSAGFYGLSEFEESDKCSIDDCNFCHNNYDSHASTDYDDWEDTHVYIPDLGYIARADYDDGLEIGIDCWPNSSWD